MVAWRRRPIPRVVQCPRQKLVWTECKKVQGVVRIFLKARPGAEAGLAANASVLEGGVVADFPRRPRRLRCIAPRVVCAWRISDLPAQKLASAARAYGWREGGGCRDGICVLDGVSGRTGSGVLAGSGTRSRLMSHVARSALCRRSVGRMGSLAVKMAAAAWSEVIAAAALTDGSSETASLKL